MSTTPHLPPWTDIKIAITVAGTALCKPRAVGAIGNMTAAIVMMIVIDNNIIIGIVVITSMNATITIMAWPLPMIMVSAFMRQTV